ncbi:MAG: hypothetical protein IJP77_06345 [Bacteroidales bacterium]|nr:hypothetical protein [Bacteroidales bacterium]
MKYIDAELLREEIEKKSHEEQGFRSEDSEYGYRSCARDLLAFIDSLQQDKETLELCSKIWWEEQGWIMIPPDATVEGIESLLKQVRKKLQQEQPESLKGKFVFPNFLYARTVDNKTIDVSYAPQSLDAIEYVRNDYLQQEQPKLYKKDESLGSPDYERGFKHGRDYQTEVTRKYTNKDKVVAYLVDKGYPISTKGEIPTYQETFDMIINAIKYANQQEQPEVDLEKEIDIYLEPIKAWQIQEAPYTSMENTARHFYGLRNRALEEAARHVYESWMGGTMDDVRRDMVELGRVINARKEE